MKKLFKKILFGNTPVSEYSTITVKEGIKEKVYLETGGTRIDISTNHWLLCLDPIVFGIWLTEKEHITAFAKAPEYKMFFTGLEEGFKPVAALKLELFDTIEAPDGTLLLVKLTQASIDHINPVRLYLIFHKYYKKPEQDFEKLKSYAAAYSYPRKVRIISFKEDDYYNIFPMDLVGDIPGGKHYVFGLRHTNVTLARIIEIKKLVVSEVPYEHKDIIYQLGKHHKDPLTEAALPFKLLHTKNYGFPIPSWANSYKEIKIIKTMDLGSHMLLWGEEINEEHLQHSSGHLFHIHFLHYLHQKRNDIDDPLV